MGSVFRKGSESSGQSAGQSNEMAALARQLFAEAAPIRQQAFGQLGTFVGGGPLPAGLTGNLATQEAELAGAREGILASGARGGQLQQSLAELPLQRLAMRDALRGQVFNTALSAALGQAPVALQGLGTAASNLNVLGAQRIQQNQLFQQGLGQTIGAGAKGLSAKGAA